jgi:RNA polymerase sigma factor (sigma-70 family)
MAAPAILADADDAWLKKVVEQFEQPLKIYVQRLLHDAEEARDVVQSVFVILTKQDSRTVEHKIGPWLFRTARNKANDVLRRRSCAEKEASGVPLACQIDPERSPLDELLHRELIGRMLKAFEELPPLQQKVIVLVVLEDRSYRDAAKCLGITEGNARILAHRGLCKIYERLTAEDLPRGGVP